MKNLGQCIKYSVIYNNRERFYTFVSSVRDLTTIMYNARYTLSLLKTDV